MNNAKIIKFKQHDNSDVLRILKQAEREADNITEIIIITKQVGPDTYSSASVGDSPGLLNYMNVVRDRMIRWS